MKTITIEIPDDLAHPAGASDEDVARDARLALAILWYDRGLISQGKGAELAGLTRTEFVDELGRAGVSAIQTNVDRRHPMRLNHLNLTVTDVLETQTFFEKYFGMKSGGGNRNIAFLTDDGSMLLTLTSMKVGGEATVSYPATFHIGFGQESEERVNEINARLKAAGFDVPAPSRRHGSWTFYFRAPGGFTIEVLA